MEHEYEESDESEGDFDPSNISGIQADKSFASLTADLLLEDVIGCDTQ